VTVETGCNKENWKGLQWLGRPST